MDQLPAPELSSPECSGLAVPRVRQMRLLRRGRHGQVDGLALGPGGRRSPVQRRLQGRGQRGRVRGDGQSRRTRGRRHRLLRWGPAADGK